MTTLLERTDIEIAALLQEIENDVERRRFLAAMGASALLLTGCDQGSAPDPEREATTHEVSDALGQVTIPTHPERIVADNVSTFAHLVALGVEPVGVAIPDGIPTSYFRPPDDTITNVVADDGWTIALEKALALQPDLILGSYAEWNNENLRRYKEAIATYAFEEGWRSTAHVYEQFRKLATDIGRTEEAEAAIAAYEAKLAAGKEALAPYLERLGAVGIVRLGGDGWVGARTAEKGHLTSTILASLGIREPAWPSAAADEDYLTLSEETLGTLNIADTLFVEANVPIADDPIAQSAMWQALDAVESDRVYYFETTWYNSDLLQLASIVDEIVAAVTGRGDPA